MKRLFYHIFQFLIYILPSKQACKLNNLRQKFMKRNIFFYYDKKKKLFKVKDGSYLIYFYGKVRGINTYSYGIESRANSLAKSYGINLINFYENDVIIDCGANFGCYSLDIWSSVNNCEIYAFEPSKKERFFLNENLKLNGASNINIIDLALGDRNGKVIFNDTRSIKEKNSGGGGFVTLNTAVSYEHYEVNITTLDKYFYNKIQNG